MFVSTALFLAAASPAALQTQVPAKPAAPPSSAALLGPTGTCPQIGGALCVPLDSSFTVVPFPFPFGSCGENDDGSVNVPLDGWDFDFYGTLWGDLFVNNNGNVSFGTPFTAFTAAGFPISGFPMIAPFWGDVDTRGAGTVWIKELSVAGGDPVNRLVITWDHVGYYNTQTDLLNTFQVILTDGQDPLIGIGNNVCFCYDDMSWTTGSASMGVGGFGGVPATVGANQGNGVDFFQVGRFDQPGVAYDGPDGASDGVDFLDGNDFCFNVGTGLSNIAPVFVTATTSFVATAGTPLTFTVEAIGPESIDTVSVTNDGGSLPGFSSVETPGNPGTSTVTYSPFPAQAGTRVVTFTAVDDGSPSGQATLEVEIFIMPAGTIGTQLCDPAQPNSTGVPARMWAGGSDQAVVNAFALYLGDAPPSVFCMPVVSQESNFVANPGGSSGDLCIASLRMGRYNMNMQMTNAFGAQIFPVDLASIPIEPGGMTAALAGETWNWQFWYRDVTPGGAHTSNFSNAVSVTFQ